MCVATMARVAIACYYLLGHVYVSSVRAGTKRTRVPVRITIHTRVHVYVYTREGIAIFTTGGTGTRVHVYRYVRMLRDVP